MKHISWPLKAILAVGLTPALAVAQNFQPVKVARRAAPMRRSNVSPYLNLLQYDQTGDQALPIYQTLVRPFVEQRRLNQFQANQVFQLQQQVAFNAVRARQSDSLRETGHATTYQNHSHFFPTVGGQK